MRDFNHTLNVLVKAFFDGTLTHGDCGACAVGNIVADSVGTREFYVAPPWHEYDIAEGWAAVFCTVQKNKQFFRPTWYKGEAKRQIDATGYSFKELARIEKAFEKYNSKYTMEENTVVAMFNGLMAVVDVLAEIHGIDLQQREEAKAMFVKS
jgi:hypothetical protein